MSDQIKDEKSSANVADGGVLKEKQSAFSVTTAPQDLRHLLHKCH